MASLSDTSLRGDDRDVGVWRSSLYTLGTLSGSIARYYEFPDLNLFNRAVKACGARGGNFFLSLYRPEEELYIKGRRVPRNSPGVYSRLVRVSEIDRLVGTTTPPLTPTAAEQPSGTFEVYRLVCGNFTPDGGTPSPSLAAPSSVGCSPYGSKMSRSLVKVAATRIFANPYQCFSELVVNSYDAYHPDQKFGKFGMGFFSVLWWVYKDPQAVFRMRSYSLGECWSLTIRMVDGDLQGDLKIHRDSRVTLSGTEIDVESDLIDAEKATAEISKLANLPGTILDREGAAYGPIIVTIKPGRISVDDFATGIPLDVLGTSLLVPSVSTKTIAGFGGTGTRLKSSVRYVEGESSTVSIAVGVVIVLKMTLETNSKGFEIIIGLSPGTHLPVSRDDILVDTPGTIKDIATQLDKILRRPQAITLYLLEMFAKQYASKGAPKANVDAFVTVLTKWREDNAGRVVPWDYFNDCYRMIGTDSLVSSTYDARKVEERFSPQAKNSPWLNVKIFYAPRVAIPTFGGLNSIIFSGSTNADLIARSLTDHFLISSNPEKGSVDAQMRDQAIAPLASRLTKRDPKVTDAYVHLISSVAVVKALGSDGKGPNPFTYFQGWMERYWDLSDEDLITVLSHFAANIKKANYVVKDASTNLTPENKHIFVSAILRSTFHDDRTLITSPWMPKGSSTSLKIAKDMEEFAVLCKVSKEGTPEHVQRFLLSRYLAHLDAKAKNMFFAAFYDSYMGILKFADEADQWIRMFDDSTPVSEPARPPGSTKYTTKKLIAALFGSNVPTATSAVAEELQFYQRAGEHPETPLQLVDIAVNDASTRSPITATLTELYQNSMDAGGKLLWIKAGVSKEALGYPSLPPEGHVVLEFEDSVAMTALNFLHVQIPFLSTKTEGSSAGEMGSGFFNAFRATSVVEIFSSSPQEVYRYFTAVPQRDSPRGRVKDIDCSVGIAAAKGFKRGTVVKCHFPCYSIEEVVLTLAEIETTVKLLAESPSGIDVYYQGINLTPKIRPPQVNAQSARGKKKGSVAPKVEPTPAVTNEWTLRAIGDSHFQIKAGKGIAFTKGVYFGPSTTIDDSLVFSDVNLLGGFEPVHSRNRINLSPELAAKIKFASSLVNDALPMTTFTHVMSQAIPSVTNDSAGRYASYEIVRGVSFITLLREVARRAGDDLRGTSPKIVPLVATVVKELVGDHPWTHLITWRVQGWCLSKVARPAVRPSPSKPSPSKPSPSKPGSKKSSPKNARSGKVSPSYYEPPPLVKEYLTSIIKKYQATCAAEKSLGMRKDPIKVTFYDNPTETGFAGFRRGDEIALGISEDSLVLLEKTIPLLKNPKTTTDTIRKLIRDRSWVWGLLGTGVCPWNQSASTIAHELEHYRRNDLEIEGAHGSREEDLFGTTANRTFDEGAEVISKWVAARTNLYS